MIELLHTTVLALSPHPIQLHLPVSLLSIKPLLFPPPFPLSLTLPFETKQSITGKSCYLSYNMMMVGKEDLGLTLSLACAHNSSNNIGFLMNRNDRQSPSSTTSPIQLNLMMMPSFASSSAALPPQLQSLPWNRTADTFPATSDRNLDACRSMLREIDVNRPAGGDEDEAGVSSPNSTVSTVSGKRSSGERESAEEQEFERAFSDEEDGGDNCRKKLRLTKDQSAILEESFKEHNTLNPKQKLALAKRLGLRPRQVEVWFQNRRARTKLKQTEVDCEYLKRCCEQLTEENRRLQKEVAELRALKLSPQFYMQMTPPTTLTMCPSCERVATPAAQPPASTGPMPWLPLYPRS